MSRLTITDDDGQDGLLASPQQEGGELRLLRQQTQAQYERLWHRDPDRFDPRLKARRRQQLQRILSMISGLSLPANARVVDLGAGSGVMAKTLAAEAGCRVLAVDVAGNAVKALQRLDLPRLEARQGFFPYLLCDDTSFDLVLCDGLIATLPLIQHRIAVSELARLVKKEGWVVCSSSVDIDSDDAVERFMRLLESELVIEKAVASYHRLFIRIADFLAAPRRWSVLCGDTDQRQNALKEAHGFAHLRLRCATVSCLGGLWRAIAWISDPLQRLWEQSDRALRWCEKASRLLWGERGISHIIVAATKRPLVPPSSLQEEVVDQRKPKRTVWE